MSIRRMSTSTITKRERYANMSAGLIKINFLVVAGGGGGGGLNEPNGQVTRASNGGGAGGYRASVEGELSGGSSSPEQPLVLGKAESFALTVGGGGAGNSGQVIGSNGQSSTFATISSLGGGGGGHLQGPGANGGSGGGSNSGSPGLGTPGQGNDGASSTSKFHGRVGGGAGGTPTGLASSITGSSVTRAVGGPVRTGTGDGVNASNNSGGGGGGASVELVSPRSQSGGNGGSGVVIFTVPTGTPVSFSSGVTDDGGNTVGSKDVYTVTAAGPTDEVTIG